MKTLFINNRDSFVYNLVDYVAVIEPDVVVVPNTISIEEVNQIKPDAIIISPGPGNPYNQKDIGSCLEVIKAFKETPMLGVCLGHQAICVAFGGRVAHSPSGPVHGKTSKIMHDGKAIYEGVETPLIGGRYHSLTVVELPNSLKVTAVGEDGIIMGARHINYPIEGVQFHPESVLTPAGKKIIQNFMEMVC